MRLESTVHTHTHTSSSMQCQHSAVSWWLRHALTSPPVLQVCRKLQQLTGGSGLGQPLTASEVAVAFGVPLSIAGEFLATAEGAAVLCRDDGTEGLRYFRNFFMDQVSVA